MKKATFSILLLSALYVQAQEVTEKNIDDVVLVGNRANNRTKLNTLVPVDVISVQKIQQSSPQTTVQDLLNYVIPSFNSVRQSASDGTEHIDPVTLRGLGPDQVLVLVNGKRRHTTSLVNYQNTVGNGSVGTDLSTIPVIAIDRIEVLRDGAAAQYGSDAISGVINIILKKNQGASASITYGQTGRNDGETYQIGANYGTTLNKDKGFINLSLQLSHRGKTNRSQNHNLDIFGDNFAYDFANDPAQARANDDAIIAQRGLTRDDFNFQVGDAQIKQGQLFLNAEYPLSDKWNLYSFGGASVKQGEGFGFRRLPSETSNVVLSIFPNGFQPVLNSKIYDFSYAVGTKYQNNNWTLDLSNTFGSNVFNYDVSNTNNASMGAQSPTEFNAGSHGFLQNTFNVDVSKKIDNFNIAFGGEWRFEQYQIKSGEEVSYKNYGLVSGAAGGAQSFIGFSDENAVKKSRNSEAIYADVSYDLEKFNVDAAARFENYSDFGSALTGKLALRYELFKNFSLRGAIGTGFRAPSLQQQYFNNSYSDISTSGNGIVNKGIFNQESAVAKEFKLPSLKEETSKNASLGFTWKPINKLYITLDGYWIGIKDRIVVTSDITGYDAFGDVLDQNIVDKLTNLQVASARFFTNAVDTETKGLDLVVSYNWVLGGGNLDINFAGNYTETKITNIHFPSSLGNESLRNQYFGPDQINIIESLSPKTKASLGLNYKINKFNFLVRNTYFGEVTRDGFPYGSVQKFSPKVVTDLSVGYDITKKLNFTVGANNLFDVFPDLQVYENSYFGVFKYAPVQMGTTGNYFFGRLNYNF